MPKRDRILEFRTTGAWPHLVTTLLLAAAVLVAVPAFLLGPPGPGKVFPLLLLALLGAGAAVFGISPTLTAHHLDSTGLTLRQGWYFRMRVPLHNIESVEIVEERIPMRGVSHHPLKNRLYVTLSKVGLVLVRLKEPVRPRGVFSRIVEEVVLSLDQPERFVEEVCAAAGIEEGNAACPACGRPLGKGRAPSRPPAPEHAPAEGGCDISAAIVCIFLVHRDGRLVTQYSSGKVKTVSGQSLGGMLTLVQGFIQDAFKTSGSELKTVHHGELLFLLEQGAQAYLALVLEERRAGRDEVEQLRGEMKAALREVHAEYGAVLEKWDGEPGALAGAKRIVGQLLWM